MSMDQKIAVVISARMFFEHENGTYFNLTFAKSVDFSSKAAGSSAEQIRQIEEARARNEPIASIERADGCPHIVVTGQRATALRELLDNSTA